MRCILLFSFLLWMPLGADDEKLQSLQERLSLHPPSQEDYVPLLEAIDSQLEAIRLHNYERAYFFYTSKDFRVKTSYHDFNQFVRANPVLLDNKSLTTTEVSINKNIGYYKGVITSTKKDVNTIHYELIFENDAWKILGIQIY